MIPEITFSINKEPFSKTEMRIALRNCGYTDGDINGYIDRGGYKGFFKALGMAPGGLIDEIKKSGIKTSGSGIPVWRLWGTCGNATGAEKYLVCDAYDCIPGASAGSALLEADPHSVIEGMLICALTAGASAGYIFINTGSGLMERLTKAVKDMKEYLSAKNDLPEIPAFEFKIIEADHCMVLDEDPVRIANRVTGNTIALSSFPATAGIKDMPTVVHTPETWANIPFIMEKGAGYFAATGSPKARGTKIISLNGAIKNKRIAEVPFGTSLRHIIEEIGGGVADGSEIKAVHIGGLEGGFLAKNDLDTLLDHDDLISKECLAGTGDIMVLDNNACIVDYTKDIVSYIQAASCGECVICREGTAQMLHIIKDISEGRGRPDDTDLLLELGDGLKTVSLCSFGKNAANIVMTGIKYFRDEYDRHIKEKKCPANVCKISNG